MPHQVYVRVLAPEPITLGIELDPLSGASAVQRLVNFLNFVCRSRSYSYSVDSPIETRSDLQIKDKAEWEDFTKSIYSLDFNRGLYQQVSLLDEVDPLACSSDGGIALISLVSELPKYCFINLGQMVSSVAVPEGVPLSAKAYLQAFYQDFIAGSLPVEYKVMLHSLASQADLFPLLSTDDIRKLFPQFFSILDVKHTSKVC